MISNKEDSNNNHNYPSQAKEDLIVVSSIIHKEVSYLLHELPFTTLDGKLQNQKSLSTLIKSVSLIS